MTPCDFNESLTIIVDAVQVILLAVIAGVFAVREQRRNGIEKSRGKDPSAD